MHQRSPWRHVRSLPGVPASSLDQRIELRTAKRFEVGILRHPVGVGPSCFDRLAQPVPGRSLIPTRRVEAGQVVGEPIFVLNGSRLNIFANAHSDLGTEKLKVDFTTVPQKGLGISMTTLINPFIMVTGTLAQPTLTLDAESTLVKGGVAVVTGGLSILATSFKNRYLSPKDPCGHAYIEADEGQRALEAKYGRPVSKTE